MRSFVTLSMEINATLLGSRRQEDYPSDEALVHKQRYDNEPHLNTALIFARDCTDIGFTGPGTINGNGKDWEGYYRAMMIRMVNCTNIRLTDIKLRNPGSWNTAFIECKNIFIRGVDIVSNNNGNGDGLDFDCCENVLVSDCLFDCSDDCICLQNSVKSGMCRNITITNCVMTSKWAAFRFGLLSVGSFRDVTVSNCVIHDVDCSGFKIQMCEGGTLENMLIENITMRNVPRPFMITLNHFSFYADGENPPPETGRLCGLKISNIIISSDEEKGHLPNSGIVIQGIKGFPITDIELTNITYTVYGGDEAVSVPLEDVPGIAHERPEYYVWNNLLPSYGMFLDQVEEITVKNLKLKCLYPSKRSAIAVRNAKDVYINGLRVKETENVPYLVTHNVQGLLIENMRPY